MTTSPDTSSTSTTRIWPSVAMADGYDVGRSGTGADDPARFLGESAEWWAGLRAGRRRRLQRIVDDAVTERHRPRMWLPLDPFGDPSNPYTLSPSLLFAA